MRRLDLLDVARRAHGDRLRSAIDDAGVDESVGFVVSQAADELLCEVLGAIGCDGAAHHAVAEFICCRTWPLVVERFAPLVAGQHGADRATCRRLREALERADGDIDSPGAIF